MKIYSVDVPEVENAREAIRIAKEVITEAGYDKFKIRNTEYDDDEDVWIVYADGDDEVSIEITIDAGTGDVDDFSTS